MCTGKPLLVHKNRRIFQGEKGNPTPSFIAVWDSSTVPVVQAYLQLPEVLQISEQVSFLVSQVDLATRLELCVSLATQPATLQTVKQKLLSGCHPNGDLLQSCDFQSNE